MIYAKVVLTLKCSTRVCCWPIQVLLVLDQGGKQTPEMIKLARVLAFDCALGTPILAIKLSGGISNDFPPRGPAAGALGNEHSLGLGSPELTVVPLRSLVSGVKVFNTAEFQFIL